MNDQKTEQLLKHLIVLNRYNTKAIAEIFFILSDSNGKDNYKGDDLDSLKESLVKCIAIHSLLLPENNNDPDDMESMLILIQGGKSGMPDGI